MAKFNRCVSRKGALEAEDLSEFVGVVAHVRKEWFEDEDPWGPWFRGQQQASWGLRPKLLRECGSYQRIKSFSKQPKQIRNLYDDFAVLRDGRYGCPQNFNRLTMAWYLNEPAPGTAANVGCVKETLDFFALGDIGRGEELTVDYRTYSDLPTESAVARAKQSRE